MNALLLARVATLTGYFGLLILLLAWYTWLSPSARYPVSLVLIVMVVPLLFPLRGLLHGKPYTHAWTTFLALYYFTLGVGTAMADPTDRVYGILQVVFSVMLFVGAMFYTRLKARAMRAAAEQNDD